MGVVHTKVAAVLMFVDAVAERRVRYRGLQIRTNPPSKVVWKDMDCAVILAQKNICKMDIVILGKFYQEVNDFISSHFNELCESHFEEFEKIDIEILHSIIQSKSIQLNDEDQLLQFINELYSKNTDYSIMYETVFFSNISSKMMKEFIKVFKFKDVSKNIWTALLSRLENEEDEINEYITELTNKIKLLEH